MSADQELNPFSLVADDAVELPLDPERVIHDLHLQRLELEAELKALREARREAERQCAQVADLYEHSPVACLTLSKDTRIRECNVAAAALLALVKSELLGQPLTNLIHAEDRTMLRSLIRTCLERRARVTGELRLDLPGAGDSVFQLIATPLGEAGAARAVCNVALADVTTITRSEERWRLLASFSSSLSLAHGGEALRAALAELVPGLADLCIADVVGSDAKPVRIARAGGKAADLWGTCQDALARQPPPPLEAGDRLLHAPLATAELARLAGGTAEAETIAQGLAPASLVVASIAVKERLLGRLVLVRRDAERRYLSSELDFARELARRMGATLDRVQQHRAEEHAARARRAVMAVTSHELKTVLSAIDAGASLASDPARDAGEAGRHLGRIRATVSRAAKCLDDFADPEAVASARMSISAQPTAVNEVIEELLELMAPLATRKRIELKRGPLSPVDAHCDRRRVLHALCNLADNALRVTPEGGTVTVHAAPLEREPFVRLTVCDTGPGLPKQVVLRLFEQGAAPEVKADAGLGLAIAKRIVEAHGGALWAESRREGGTALHFTLPSVN